MRDEKRPRPRRLAKLRRPLLALVFFASGWCAAHLLPAAGNLLAMSATQRGDVGALGFWLDRGVSPNARIRYARFPDWAGHAILDRAEEKGWGVPLLVFASQAGRSETVRLLIARGADPNGSDGAGYTPLMAAAGRGDLATIEELLRAGADPTRRWKDGSRPDRDAPSPAVRAKLAEAIRRWNARQAGA